MHVHPARPKTLIFCTAYVPSGKAGTHVPSPDTGTMYLPSETGIDPFYTWDRRYRIWLHAIATSSLHYDQILVVDDGSAELPDWPDAQIVCEGSDYRTDAGIVLYHFEKNLGRYSASDFPGWVRSFFFAARYARDNGFQRVIHIESDAFIISTALQAYVNSVSEGWLALWSRRHIRPESAIQVIAGRALQTFFYFGDIHYEVFKDVVVEQTLPFTHVARQFAGDRYGEYSNFVPRIADWCAQARPDLSTWPSDYYWWMPGIETVAGGRPPLTPKPVEPTEGQFFGIFYHDFLAAIDRLLGPRNYLEIGSQNGHTLRRISCDAVSVDPKFEIFQDIIGTRCRTYLYQGRSDDFFAEGEVLRHFPRGIDFAFLAGLQRFELLLRDFINVGKYSHPGSIAVLQNCLPLNERMARRERAFGGEDENQQIRDWWTGDVWKVMSVLQRYRWDLNICAVDSGPVGLIVCTGLQSRNDVLSRNYDDIVARYNDPAVAFPGALALRAMFPMYSSIELATSVATMEAALRLRRG